VILVVDNHDSFTWNLVHALARHGRRVEVVQSDATSLADVVRRRPVGLVLSPGPGRPEQAGVSLALVQALAGRVSLFGVCLGHQVICAAFGARVQHAARLMHGRTSLVRHDDKGVFEGLPNPLRVARYHSLLVAPESLPAGFTGTAFTEAGELMAVRHARWDVEAVQFHPESFMTEHGAELLGRWVAGLPQESQLAASAARLGVDG
jgi:anthranilate synthase/aminodeoxychorismate synthase-like glutamine amidotransferase